MLSNISNQIPKKRRNLLVVDKNSNTLKYRLCGEKNKSDKNPFYSSPFRTYTDLRITTSIKTSHRRKNKKYLPVVDGRKQSYGKNKDINFNVIAIDFDQLPPDCKTFEELTEKLEPYFNNIGVSVGSFSNKTKYLVKVAIKNKCLTKSQAIEIIENILPKEYHSYYDQQGIFLFFLHSRYCISQIKKLKNFKGLDSSQYNEFNKKPKYKYIEYSGSLPEELLALVDSPKKERFYRILLSMRKLTCDEGFDISTSLLAYQLETTKKTASSWIKSCIKNNLITCINSSHIPNKKARTYKATELLTQLINSQLPKTEETVTELSFPTQIEDGSWNKTLLALSLKFAGTKEDFLNNIKNIQGYDQKDRLKQAERVYNWSRDKKPTIRKTKSKVKKSKVIEVVQPIEMFEEVTKEEMIKEYKIQKSIDLNIIRKVIESRKNKKVKVEHNINTNLVSVVNLFNDGSSNLNIQPNEKSTLELELEVDYLGLD